jgi:GNAT superfamily N-acetyltransferase
MITIRRATESDQGHLGRFGGALVRQHHAADPRRFIAVDDPETGYGRYLVSQLANPHCAILVAEHSGAVVGYVWATLEATNWMQLRGPCGVVQDLYVDASARRLGAGRALLRAALEWIRAQGRSQVVLMTKTRNETALRLFAAVGFRSSSWKRRRSAMDEAVRSVFREWETSGTPARTSSSSGDHMDHLHILIAT